MKTPAVPSTESTDCYTPELESLELQEKTETDVMPSLPLNAIPGELNTELEILIPSQFAKGKRVPGYLDYENGYLPLSHGENIEYERVSPSRVKAGMKINSSPDRSENIPSTPSRTHKTVFITTPDVGKYCSQENSDISLGPQGAESTKVELGHSGELWFESNISGTPLEKYSTASNTLSNGGVICSPSPRYDCSATSLVSYGSLTEFLDSSSPPKPIILHTDTLKALERVRSALPCLSIMEKLDIGSIEPSDVGEQNDGGTETESTLNGVPYKDPTLGLGQNSVLNMSASKAAVSTPTQYPQKVTQWDAPHKQTILEDIGTLVDAMDLVDVELLQLMQWVIGQRGRNSVKNQKDHLSVSPTLCITLQESSTSLLSKLKIKWVAVVDLVRNRVGGKSRRVKKTTNFDVSGKYQLIPDDDTPFIKPISTKENIRSAFPCTTTPGHSDVLKESLFSEEHWDKSIELEMKDIKQTTQSPAFSLGGVMVRVDSQGKESSLSLVPMGDCSISGVCGSGIPEEISNDDFLIPLFSQLSEDGIVENISLSSRLLSPGNVDNEFLSPISCDVPIRLDLSEGFRTPRSTSV